MKHFDRMDDDSSSKWEDLMNKTRNIRDMIWDGLKLPDREDG